MDRRFNVIVFVVAGLAALAVAVTCVACAWDLWNQNRPRIFSGIVYDCETGEPIADANIQLRQQSILTWTQFHVFNGTSDAQGRFEIHYNIGHNISVRTSKDGYLLSDDYSFPGAAQIGLIKKAANEADLWRRRMPRYSQNCKRAFKCHTEALKNGVKVVTDQCGALQPLGTPIRKTP